MGRSENWPSAQWALKALAHECTSPDPSTHGSTSQAIYNYIALTSPVVCPYSLSLSCIEYFHNSHCTDAQEKAQPEDCPNKPAGKGDEAWRLQFNHLVKKRTAPHFWPLSSPLTSHIHTMADPCPGTHTITLNNFSNPKWLLVSKTSNSKNQHTKWFTRSLGSWQKQKHSQPY